MEGKIHALIVTFHSLYPRSTVGVAFGAYDVLLATTTADKDVQVRGNIFTRPGFAKSNARG
jgi:hypothetical protein